MKKALFIFCWLSSIALPGYGSSDENTEPKIAVSIPPIHSLVSMVTAGITEPVLIFDGLQSPHSQQLKPSMVRTILGTDLAIIVSDTFEQSISRTLESSDDSNVLRLIAGIPESLILRTRGKHFANHGHREGEEAGYDDEHGNELLPAQGLDSDPHLWLSANVAIKIVDIVADRLSTMDPDNADRYYANRDMAKKQIADRKVVFRNRLEAVHHKRFLVFHDAFQYFEKEYDLSSAGAFVIRPDVMPGAKKVVALRQKISDDNVVCVFSEPQFDSRKVDAMIEGLTVTTATLDPLGAHLSPGPTLWFKMMENLVGAFYDCLSNSN